MGNRRVAKERKNARKVAPRDAASGGDDGASFGANPRLSSFFATGFKWVLGGCLVLGLAGGLAYGAHRFALTSARFSIVDIQVDGAHRLPSQEVERLAGVRVGLNIFAVSVEEAEAGLGRSPWVTRARITRRLPGTLRINVEERVPAALLVLDGKTLLVSSEGEPFKTLEPGDPEDFPLITGVSSASLLGDRRGELGRISEGLALLDTYAHLPRAPAYPAEELHLTDTGEAVLTIGREGTALHLGRPPYKQKLLRAARVMGKAQAEGGFPQVIFLDSAAHPERVVVRVR